MPLEQLLFKCRKKAEVYLSEIWTIIFCKSQEGKNMMVVQWETEVFTGGEMDQKDIRYINMRKTESEGTMKWNQ